jgi:crossover junction endodeoxyribonuclease RusA
MSDRISFTVPLSPPSVNHYAKHTRTGRHYRTGEADAYKSAVAACAAGKFVQAKRFTVAIDVVLAKGQRGDVDNFPKLVLDGLADCGALRDLKGKRISDAHVRALHVTVDDDSRPDEGYTRIVVEALKQ